MPSTMMESTLFSYTTRMRSVLDWLSVATGDDDSIVQAANNARKKSTAAVPETVLENLSSAIDLRAKVRAAKVQRVSWPAGDGSDGKSIEGDDCVTAALCEAKRVLSGESHLVAEMIGAMGVQDEVAAVNADLSGTTGLAARVGEVVRIRALGATTTKQSSHGFKTSYRSVNAPENSLDAKFGLIRAVHPDMPGTLEVLVDGAVHILHSTYLEAAAELGADHTEAERVMGATAEFGACCFAMDVAALLSEVERAWRDYKASKITHLTATALTNLCVRHATAWADALESEHSGLHRIEHVLACAYLHGAIQWARASLGANAFETSFETAVAVVAELAFGYAASDAKVAASATGLGRPIMNAVALSVARLEPDETASEPTLKRAHATIKQRVPAASAAQCDALIDVVVDCAALHLLGCASAANVAVMADEFGQEEGDPLAGANGLLLTSE